ncbi:MAG: MFS transporter [Mycobacteriales bacterium]
MSRPDLNLRLARVALFVGFFVQGLCFATLITQVPEIRDRFSFSDTAVSLILLVVALLAGVGSVLAGLSAARWGSGVTLRAAQIALCAGLAGAGAATRTVALYGALALLGLAIGAVDATLGMQAVVVQTRYGRSIMTSFHATWSVAGITGALAGFLASREHVGLGVLLGTTAAVGAAGALAAGRWLLPSGAAPVPGGTESGDAATVAAVPWRPVVLLGLVLMFMYIGDSSVSNWSTVYLHDTVRGAKSTAKLGYAAYQATTVVGRVFGDRAVIRFGAARLVRWGAVVAAAGFALVAASPGVIVGIAAFAVIGVGLCVIGPQVFTAAGALDPAETGVAVARVNVFNYLGFVIGAPLVGALGDAASMRLAFLVPTVLVLAIIGLAGAMQPSREVTTRVP